MPLNEIFPLKPFIGCIHLMALPGAPLYEGSMDSILDVALEEALTFEKHGFDGLIIENFRDKPFYPREIPAETVAAMAAIGRQIVKSVKLPVGINALRNDGRAAIAIANAAGAHFVRVNVHLGAVVADQGILEGMAHQTLRLRESLKCGAKILADVGVKHAVPLVDRGLELEARDLEARGMVDGLIVSGDLTGGETDIDDLTKVKAAVSLPVIIGSGMTAENLGKYFSRADGFIVGSYFKQNGKPDNFLDGARVEKFAGLARGFR